MLKYILKYILHKHTSAHTQVQHDFTILWNTHQRIMWSETWFCPSDLILLSLLLLAGILLISKLY